MVKTHNRIIAGALSIIMIGQIASFGDGTTKGILHPDTIAYAAEEAKTRAKSIGANSYETVIKFTTNCTTFIRDNTVGDGAFRNMVDGDVKVSNVTEVGFKTIFNFFKR